MATPLRAPDVVGVTEFAALAGVSRKTVSSWLARGADDLPPATRLAGGAVWNRRQVLAWIASRAPVDGCSDCRDLGRNCNR